MFSISKYSALLIALILHQTASLTAYFGFDSKWKPFGDGITILVDISSYNLTKTPHIFTRISCANYCWGVSGPTSIYEQSKDSFKVYLRLSDPNWAGLAGKLTTTIAYEYNFILYYVLFVEEPTNQTTAVVNQTTSSSLKEVVDQTPRDLIIAAIVIAGFAALALIVLVVVVTLVLIKMMVDF